MNDKILKEIVERDLHCVLNKYCSEILGIKVKTIYHEQSTKNKGKSEWLHPDMVGFQLTTSNWDSNITNVCKDFSVSKALLYSFELKKSITVDTLREYYFQAVSNSSWANEGYLVAASIDEMDSDLISEIKRLVGAFGIGIIKLDILNPSNSSILFTARRKDVVDGETMNKLYSINPNYREYIQNVSNSLQINTMIQSGWDNVYDYEKLLSKINYKDNKQDVVESKVVELESKSNKELKVSKNKNVEYIDSSIIRETFEKNNVILTFTKPVKCIVENREYIATNWAEILFDMAICFRGKNIDLFNEYVGKSKYFTKSDIYKESVYNKELELYMRPLDANGKYKEMQLLLKIYGVDLFKSELYYVSTKK